MSLHLTELRSRIEAFEIDDPKSSLPFTDRLARENGWSKDYAARVLREYKRFAMMAVTGNGPVTPSDPVDQVWHLHLCYTRSYWEEFCGKVLQTPLHHEPTRGGRDEHLKHEDQYTKTLLLYHELFGEAPPPDIWPRVQDCFRSGARMVRANRDEVWLVPKPSFRRSTMLVLAVSLLLLGCTPAVVGGPLFAADLWVPGPLYLAILGGLYVAIWIVTIQLRRAALDPIEKPDLPSDFVSGEDFLYERAFLVGGAGRVVDTVLMKLIREQRISYDSTARTFAVLDSTRNQRGEFEEEALNLIERDPQLRNARAAIFAQAEAIYRNRIDRLGLLADPGRASRVRLTSGWMAFLLLLASAFQLNNGITNHRPVGYLGFGMVVLFFTWMAFINWRPFRNRRGEEVVTELTRYHDTSKNLPANATTNGHQTDIAISIFGMAILQGTEFGPLSRQIAPASYKSNGSSLSGCSTSGCGTSSSGGGGDGGSSCGSGCGGCGGGGD